MTLVFEIVIMCFSITFLQKPNNLLRKQSSFNFIK